jgi:hypothetical protein
MKQYGIRVVVSDGQSIRVGIFVRLNRSYHLDPRLPWPGTLPWDFRAVLGPEFTPVWPAASAARIGVWPTIRLRSATNHPISV